MRRPNRAITVPDFNEAAHAEAHYPRILVYTSATTLVTTVSAAIYPPRGGKIASIHANVQGAPVSTVFKLDVLIGGTSILSGTDYIQIAVGDFSTGLLTAALFDEPYPGGGDANASFAAFEKLQVQINTISSATGPMVVQLEIDWED